jgi:predicted CXXCH cytochrome family protein
MAILLSTLFVLAACEREKKEEVPAQQTETAPPPAREDMQAPAESPPPAPGEPAQPRTGEEGTGGEYTTPQEGERRGMQDLEVVDKNISEATDQPSSIGTPGTDSGPETVVFEAKNGNVTFPHQAHGEREDCTSCHEQTPPEKLELTQESAHKLCRGCHEERGAGPVKCLDCHKKE